MNTETTRVQGALYIVLCWIITALRRTMCLYPSNCCPVTPQTPTHTSDETQILLSPTTGAHSFHMDGRWRSPATSAPLHKLAGVKHSLYHPLLPTLRRMEMDSIGHKLSEEHSRTSTPCTRENFHPALFTTYDLPEHRLPSLEVTDTGRLITQSYGMGNVVPLLPGMTQDEWLSFTQAADDWYKRHSSSGELELRDLQKTDLGYSGYAVRFLSPKVTRSWRYCLQQNPSLDHHGQKPLPVETTNTFRTFGSSYSPNTYLRPWH